MEFPSHFNIGPVRIAPATVLAPMAGVTDTVFRRFIRNLGGCGLIMTEFTSSHGVSASLRSTKASKTVTKYLAFEPEEHPISAQLFGADPHVLGRRILADEDGYTIVGVMPPDFRHPSQGLAADVELWTAAGFKANPFPLPPSRGYRYLPGALGRLKPGLTVQQAQQRLDAFVAELSRSYSMEYPAASRW